MTEEERQAKLAHAITYWLPIRWDADGSQYERLRYDFTGDVTSGGVTVTASKDGTASVEIKFSNEDCYGDAQLDAVSAMTKFLAAFGS